MLRLLLLALLSLWLARPVLSGLDDTRPWTVAVPGVDAGLARASSDARARLHWLAPDFPSLDEPAPAGTPAIGSLLRQLDAELPTGVALTVIVPATLQGADAERPALSRAVTWKVVDGAMPASSARASPPPSLAIRHPAGDELLVEVATVLQASLRPTDSLARWSDDQLPSNFHRVKNPLPGEYMGPRYSIAFFAQANRDAIIEGPGKKYPAIAAGDYLNQRVAANFKAY